MRQGNEPTRTEKYALYIVELMAAGHSQSKAPMMTSMINSTMRRIYYINIIIERQLTGQINNSPLVIVISFTK